LLHLFGASGPLWFSNIWLARATIVVANLWLALPFDILVLLAGLANLPLEPLEAARVDGASPTQILAYVTLPLLRPVIAVILVIRAADAFRIFDVVYVLTGGGPANKTDVLSTFIYRQMFSAFDFAGGAAASVLLVVVTSLASLAVVLGLRDRSLET
jgi:multiple sugar transport system permease protein